MSTKNAKRAGKQLKVALALVMLAAACGSATEPIPTPPARPTPLPVNTAQPVVVVANTAAPPTDVANTPAALPLPTYAPLAPGQAVTITLMQMLDPQIGWSIGGPVASGRHVLRTSDGGQTWRDVSPPVPGPSGVLPVTVNGAFANAERAWVIYGLVRLSESSLPVVWYSGDGGETWEASAPLETRGLGYAHFFLPSDMHFLPGGQHGWFVAHLGVTRSHDFFTVYHTDDGGATWRPLFSPTQAGPQRCLKTGLQFTSTERGWLTGACQVRAAGLYFQATQDGGATWQPVRVPPPASAPDLFERADTNCGTRDLSFFSPEVGHVVVSCLILSAEPLRTEAFLYTTADGGQTWTSNPVPARGTTWLDTQTGWAHPTQGSLTEPWELAYTTDGGQTWETLAPVAWYGPVDFVDPLTGWAIAYQGDQIDLLHSVDGGRTWQPLAPRVASPTAGQARP